jgi:ribosomal-protein-alanine N-acetyltransferase
LKVAASPRISAAPVAAAPRIAALQKDAFEDPWDVRFVTSLMHLPGTIAYVAERDGRDAGYVMARALWGEAEILSIAVAEAARGRGVGAALLGHALAAAAAAGACDVHLEVSVANAAARALYARAGFVESGRRRRYYADGSDALTLRRTLPAA